MIFVRRTTLFNKLQLTYGLTTTKVKHLRLFSKGAITTRPRECNEELGAGGTYGIERELAFVALIAAGVGFWRSLEARDVADNYFKGELRFTDTTRTAYPGKSGPAEVSLEMSDISRLLPVIRTAASLAVNLLAAGDYDTLERVTRGRHMSAAELRSAVEEYGRELIEPPDEAFDQQLRVYPIPRSDPPAFKVLFDMWTVEEGVSDLTLALDLTEIPRGLVDTEIESLHVM